MKKRALLVVLCVALSAGIAFASGSKEHSATSSKTITMKIGMTQTVNSPRMIGSNVIKSYVEQKSGGRIKVQIYPNSELGSSKQEIEEMQSGSIQMTIFPTTSATTFDHYLTLGDIPYLFPTTEKKLLELYKTKAFTEYMDTLQKYGIQPLAAWFEGFATITSKTPVKKVSDFRNLKLRIIGSNLAKRYYTDLGTPPSSIAFSQVYTALETGRINALDIPPHDIWEKKFYEVDKYITRTKHFNLTSLVMVNKQWYDSLSPDLQRIVAEGAQKGLPAEVKYVNDETTKAISQMKSKGVTFYPPTTAVVNALKQERSKAEGWYVQTNGSQGKKILDDMQQAINNLQ